MVLKTVIIDDEDKAIQSLSWELENFCPLVENVASFTNPEEALIFLNQNEIDCIFLDIEMPKMDGIQFLSYFTDREFLVVFTTAYDQYAIEAIKKQAFDYLLKPVDSDDLIETVRKASIAIAKQKSLASSSLSLDKIKLNVDGQFIYLNSKEIIYCKSDGNYCDIYLTKQKRLTVTKKLKELDDILPSSIYIRVHNSYIVNIDKVRSYSKKDSCITLIEGTQIPVSRQRKFEFLEKMG